MTQIIGTHAGYTLTLFGSVSYCCDALGLRGFRTEGQLIRAINKQLRATKPLPGLSK